MGLIFNNNNKELLGIFKITDEFDIRKIVNNITSPFKDYIPVFFKNHSEDDLEFRLTKLLSKAKDINPSLAHSLTKYRITNDINSVKNLLDSDLVIGYIMSGKDGVDYLFYPLLVEYLTSNKVKNKNKEGLVNRLKFDIDRAKKITSADLIPSRRKIAEEGCAYVSKTIANVIKPFKM